MSRKAKVTIMIRLRVASLLLLSAVAYTPAVAADLGAAPVSIRGSWIASPSLAVNQGPEYSGPNMVIAYIGLTPDHGHMSYPFIGTSDPAPRFGPSRDYYTVYPRTIHRTIKRVPRHVPRRAVRALAQVPVKASAAR
jgi:hypothetical protein